MVVTAVIRVPATALAGGGLAGRVTLVGSGAQAEFVDHEELVRFLAAHSDGRLGRRPTADGVPLSGQQQRVGALLSCGRTNDEIARELGIAEGTVRKHLERIYRRLGVRNRAEAVAVLLAGGTGPPGRL